MLTMDATGEAPLKAAEGAEARRKYGVLVAGVCLAAWFVAVVWLWADGYDFAAGEVDPHTGSAEFTRTHK